jgi:signal transduction histidine kinase
MGSTALALDRLRPGALEIHSASQPESEKPPDAVEALAGLAHDARNLVTALRLCAELLGEPGVLQPENAHYATEIAAMAEASAGLMRKLAALARAGRQREIAPEETPVTDVAETLRHLGGLLAAIAGPKIVVQTECLPCAGTLRLSEESLTRVLLNLVRNAADAMAEGGRIRITAQRGGGASFFWTLPEEMREDTVETVVVTVEDNGAGIPPELVERIFEPGFSTRRSLAPWPEAQHQGLGLSIARQLVENAGGTIRAGSAGRQGARFEIELPLTKVTPSNPPKEAIVTGGGAP